MLPTLLSWPASVVVHDIKGENWALTAGWRRQELGSACLKFDPTADDGSSARYNPLLEVRPWPDDVQGRPEHRRPADRSGGRGGSRSLGSPLEPDGPRPARGRDPPRPLRGARQDVPRVPHLPRRPDPSDRERAQLDAHDRPRPRRTAGWTDPSTGQPTRTHPVVAGAARALLNKSDNERSSVVSSAVKFLNLYRDPIVAANTETCDFALRDLLGTDRPVSLYLTTPPSDIIRTRSLLRLLLNQIGPPSDRVPGCGGMSGSPRPPRLLLMLDEFPALGRLDFLQTALAYLPGYGITRVPDRPGPRPARPDVRPRRVHRLELPRPGRLRGEQGRDRQGDLGDGRRDDRASRRRAPTQGAA